MSVFGLRVDVYGTDSSAADIFRYIRNRDSLIAILICLKRIGILLPRDLRRLISIYCTEPASSIIPDVSLECYYAHYLSHPTTRWYNPILHCTGGGPGGIFLMVHMDSSNARLCTFQHPFSKLLRGRAATADTYWVQFQNQLNLEVTVEADSLHIYRFTLPRYGDIYIGVEHDPYILDVTISVQTFVDEQIICKLTSSVLNIRSFHLLSDSVVDGETPEMFRDRIEAAYRPNYNKIIGFDRFLRPHRDFNYTVTVKTRKPIDNLGLVCLFVPPELII